MHLIKSGLKDHSAHAGAFPQLSIQNIMNRADKQGARLQREMTATAGSAGVIPRVRAYGNPPRIGTRSFSAGYLRGRGLIWGLASLVRCSSRVERTRAQCRHWVYAARVLRLARTMAPQGPEASKMLKGRAARRPTSQPAGGSGWRAESLFF